MQHLHPSLTGHNFTAICPKAVAQAHADSDTILEDNHTMYHHLLLWWTAVQTTYMSLCYCTQPLQPSLAGHNFTAICPKAVAQAHADSENIQEDNYTMYLHLHLGWTEVQDRKISVY